MARRLFTVVASISLLLCAGLLALWLWSERGGTLMTPPRPSNAPIQQMLSRPLPGVNFNGVALADVLDFVRDVSGMPVLADWAALGRAGVSRNATVNVNLSGVRLGEALAAVIQPYPTVAYVTRGNEIVITTSAALRADPAVSAVPHPATTRPTQSDPRIREAVIGQNRWTASAEHSVLYLWRNPVDPASAYHPPPARSASTYAEATEFAGFAVRSLGYPFHSTQVQVPLWAPVAAAALLPLAWVFAMVRRRRCVGAGKCRNCGYDLRATPGRCPECGSEAVTAGT